MIFESLAKQLCSKSNHKSYHHGVVCVSGGAIVAMGHNYNHIHAEVNALKKIWPSERKGIKVYSFRFSKGGKFAMAKPCSRCEAFLRENGVKTVYYTDGAGDMKRMKL